MILLDTHAWLWVLGDVSRLGDGARNRIDQEVSIGGLGISDISLWETAMLAQKRRIEIAGSFLPWLENAIERSCVNVHPITPEIAFQSTLFPEQLSDPADRIIAATAKCLGVGLVTKDRSISTTAGVETVW